MKAITICQPHAWAVIFGDKPFENRTWPTKYRGPLLIHAGVSRKWLNGDDYGDNLNLRQYEGQPHGGDLVFGAIIGVVEMVGCITPAEQAARDGERHPTAEGPWCHEYRRRIAFSEPVKCSGQLNLWSPSAEVLAKVREQIRKDGGS